MTAKQPQPPPQPRPIRAPATLDTIVMALQAIHHVIAQQSEARVRAGTWIMAWGAPLLFTGGLGTLANIIRSADGMQVDPSGAISLVIIAMTGVVLLVVGSSMWFSRPQ